jgi:hypothetical protein
MYRSVRGIGRPRLQASRRADDDDHGHSLTFSALVRRGYELPAMRVTKEFRDAIRASKTFTQERLARAARFQVPEFSVLLRAPRIPPTTHTVARMWHAAHLLGFAGPVLEASPPTNGRPDPDWRRGAPYVFGSREVKRR